MGYISKLAKASQPVPAPVKKQSSRGVWREVFQGHSVTKEDHLDQMETNRGRTIVSTDAATKRLLQALRSMAPGGWSDDRWEQTRHFNGIPYVAIHRAGEQLSQAEFQVYETDPKHPDGKRPAKSKGGEDLIKLLEKPNPEDSFGDMMYRWNQQLGLTGMALTWMVPNRLGYPMEIYSIPTAIAIPQPAVNPDFPDGYYRIQPVYPYGPFSSCPLQQDCRQPSP